MRLTTYSHHVIKENSRHSAPMLLRSSTPSPSRSEKVNSSKLQYLSAAKEIIRNIKVLKEKEDLGLEDCIRSVTEDKNMCNQQDLS